MQFIFRVCQVLYRTISSYCKYRSVGMLEAHLIANNFKFKIIISLQEFIQIIAHRYVPFTKVICHFEFNFFSAFQLPFRTKNEVHSIVIYLIKHLCTNCNILDSQWTKNSKNLQKPEQQPSLPLNMPDIENFQPGEYNHL